MQSRIKVKVEWAIKGYLHFKIIPSKLIPMDLVPEEDNLHDPNAVVVQMPSLEQIDQTNFQQMTEEEKQQVKKVAGNDVGRVPANLCGAFREIMGKYWLLEDIKCHYNGIVSDSVNPPKYQKFERNPSGGLDTPGGGVDLLCTYVLIVEKEYLQACNSIFERRLRKEDFEKVTYEDINM